jgi:hypothetical protein
VDAELLRTTRPAGVLSEHDGKLRCAVRLSTVVGELCFHSGFPTSEQDAVFRPRYLSLGAATGHAECVADGAPRGRIGRGCGAGAAFRRGGAFAADINQRAPDVGSVNCQLAGAGKVHGCYSDLLTQLEGEFDLVISNPADLLARWRADLPSWQW